MGFCIKTIWNHNISNTEVRVSLSRNIGHHFPLLIMLDFPQLRTQLLCQKGVLCNIQNAIQKLQAKQMICLLVCLMATAADLGKWLKRFSIITWLQCGPQLLSTVPPVCSSSLVLYLSVVLWLRSLPTFSSSLAFIANQRWLYEDKKHQGLWKPCGALDWEK